MILIGKSICYYLLMLPFLFASVQGQNVTTLSSNPVLNGGITLNKEGELFVATNGVNGVLNGSKIYKVDRETGEAVEYISGLQPWPIEMDFDNLGNLYVTDWGLGGVYKFDRQLQRSVFVAGISGANGLEIDTLNNVLYVMSFYEHRVYKVNSLGNKSILSSGGSISYPAGIAFHESSGELYVANWFDGRIVKISADGSQTLFANLTLPSGTGMPACMILGEYLYVTAYAAHRIYRVRLATAEISVFAGSDVAGTVDGTLLEAQFISPGPMVASEDGSIIYVTQDSLATTTGAGNGSVREIHLNPSTSVDDRNSSIPGTMQVAPNYPNPFNPSTTIEFRLPTASVVTLDIYDIFGRHVVTLYRASLPSGTHKFIWNATDAAGKAATSGVYVYQVSAGKTSVARKMILLR